MKLFNFYYCDHLLNEIEKEDHNDPNFNISTNLERAKKLAILAFSNNYPVKYQEKYIYIILRSLVINQEHEKALNVLFIELGDTCMNTSVAKLSKKKIEMKSDFCDDSICGHLFTEILEKYLMKKVIEKYKINPQTNKRSLIRFKQACEKAKKTLSSNPVVLFEVPSLMNDIDVSVTVKRDEFNSITKDCLSKIKNVIEKAIENAEIKKEDISFSTIFKMSFLSFNNI